MSRGDVVGGIALGIALAIGAPLTLVAWRLTENLEKQTQGIVLGMVVMAVAIGALVIPFVILILRSRMADMTETLAILGRDRSTINYSPTQSLGPGGYEQVPPVFGGMPSFQTLDHTFGRGNGGES